MKTLTLTSRFFLLSLLALFTWNTSLGQEEQTHRFPSEKLIEFRSDFAKLCSKYPHLELCSLKSELCPDSKISDECISEEIQNNLCSKLTELSSNICISEHEQDELYTIKSKLCFGNDMVIKDDTINPPDDDDDPCKIRELAIALFQFLGYEVS